MADAGKMGDAELIAWSLDDEQTVRRQQASPDMWVTMTQLACRLRDALTETVRLEGELNSMMHDHTENEYLWRQSLDAKDSEIARLEANRG